MDRSELEKVHLSNGGRSRTAAACSGVRSSEMKVSHTYPQHFFKFQTWQMTVVYYKVHYLPGGVRIWFRPNCRVGVFGDMANFASEIG